MVTARPSTTVHRSEQRLVERDVEISSESSSQLEGRVDPVSHLPGPCPGNRHDRKPGNPRSDCLHDEVGIGSQTPILEPVDQLSSRTHMLEGGDQSNPTVENPLRSGPEISPTSRADGAGARREASLTEHPTEGTADSRQN